MADKVATYSIRVDSNAKQVGAEGAEGLEQLKGSIGRSQDAIKLLSSAMRGLKGSSDEVKGAREALKAQMEAEKGALTATTLALLKQGTSFDQLASKEKAAASATKKAAEEQEKARAKVDKSVAAAGGPLAELREKFATLDEAMSTSEGRAALAAKGLAGLASVAIGAAVAIGVVVAALAAGAIALGKWIIESANAQRDMALQREAWTGSAANAKAFGNQIDALGRKIATPKEELNELSGSLSRALSGTRVSGQGIVDTFNAVAQASAAMGKEAGSQIEEIIKRSARFGRVSINPFELQGSGLKQRDVAAQLAKDLGVGVNQAQLALMQGRVKVDDAAKALREAVEKRFGEVNAKKLISLDASAIKLKKNLSGLTSDVKFDGLLRSVSKLADLFDSTTFTGKTLKTIVTTIGNTLGKGFEDSIPKIKTAFLTAELATLKFLITVYKVDSAIAGVFGKDWKGSLLGKALDNFEAQARAIAKGFQVISDVLDRLEGKSGAAGKNKTQVVGSAVDDQQPHGRKLGDDLTKGIEAGIKSGAVGPIKAAKDLVGDIKAAFAKDLEIHSPSKVFERFGLAIPQGAEKGVDKGAGGLGDAVGRMADKAAPSSQGAGAAPRRGTPAPAVVPAIHVHLHVPPGPAGPRS